MNNRQTGKIKGQVTEDWLVHYAYILMCVFMHLPKDEDLVSSSCEVSVTSLLCTSIVTRMYNVINQQLHWLSEESYGGVISLDLW